MLLRSSGNVCKQEFGKYLQRGGSIYELSAEKLWQGNKANHAHLVQRRCQCCSQRPLNDPFHGFQSCSTNSQQPLYLLPFCKLLKQCVTVLAFFTTQNSFLLLYMCCLCLSFQNVLQDFWRVWRAQNINELVKSFSSGQILWAHVYRRQHQEKASGKVSNMTRIEYCRFQWIIAFLMRSIRARYAWENQTWSEILQCSRQPQGSPIYGIAK